MQSILINDYRTAVFLMAVSHLAAMIDCLLLILCRLGPSMAAPTGADLLPYILATVCMVAMAIVLARAAWAIPVVIVGNSALVFAMLLPSLDYWTQGIATLLIACIWAMPLVLSIIAAAAIGPMYCRGPIKPGHCEFCGYDLTGAPGNECPECGVLFRPTTVDRADHPLKK